MIPESRLFIKAGLLYLLGGMLLLLIDSLPGVATGVRLLPLYWHMIVIGWITQVIIGVSIWMFPARDRSQRGKPPPWGRTLFWMLNAGLVLRLVSEPFADAGWTSFWVSSALILSILLQTSALLLYAVTIWPRVQPKRSRKSKRRAATVKEETDASR